MLLVRALIAHIFICGACGKDLPDSSIDFPGVAVQHDHGEAEHLVESSTEIIMIDPSDHGTHTPEHGTHQPGHGTHPPEHGTHPPGHGTHQPEHGTHPPGHGTHPPEHGTHPPGAATHPPDHGGGGHSMPMYFHVGVHNTILFEKWHTMIWQELLGSCIGIAIIALLYEGLKFLRDWLSSKRYLQASKICPQCVHQKDIDYQTQVKLPTSKPKLSPFDCIHVIQSLLHAVQLFLSLSIMLVAMTFNAYLMIAICIGGALGYFIFSWKRFSVQDPNECCN